MTPDAPNPYKDNDEYMLIDAQMMFDWGGNNDWGNLVRGCLVCALKKGAGMHEAHMFCYKNAADRAGYWHGAWGFGRAAAAASVIGVLQGCAAIKG